MSSRKSVGSINLHSEANKKYHLVWKYFSKVIHTFFLFLYLYTTYCCFQGVPGPMVIELYNPQKFFTHVSSMSKCVTNSTISSNIVYYVSCLKRPPSHRSCKWSVLQVFMWHFQRKKLVQGFTSSEMRKCK